MNKKRFAQIIEQKGWEYVLTRVSPDSLSDAILGEALSDAQDAFYALLEVAPSVDDFAEEKNLSAFLDVLDEEDLEEDEEGEEEEDVEDFFGRATFERNEED